MLLTRTNHFYLLACGYHVQGLGATKQQTRHWSIGRLVLSPIDHTPRVTEMYIHDELENNSTSNLSVK